MQQLAFKLSIGTVSNKWSTEKQIINTFWPCGCFIILLLTSEKVTLMPDKQ